MSKADELLASIDDRSTHTHALQDTDGHFAIYPDIRSIVSLSALPNILMQHDHRSEAYTFEIPRYIEGHDMLQCNRTRLHYINVDNSGTQEYRDATDLEFEINPDNSGISEMIIAKWEIRREATQYAGHLSFLIDFQCVSSGGEVEYDWHTDYYSDIEIRATHDSGEAIAIEYPNILEDWYQKILTDFKVDVDATLTTPGVAADAKAAGDRLAILEQFMADQKYVKIAISSFANKVDSSFSSTNYVEIGRSISKVSFTWSFNKTPKTVTFNGTEQQPDKTGNATLDLDTPLAPTAYPSTTSWSLSATDERAATASGKTSVTFTNGVYYGVIEDGTALDSSAILKMSKALQTNYKMTFTLNPSGNQRMTFAIPVSYGTPTFNIGPFDYSWNKAATIAFTNASGFTEQYNIWQHSEIVTGSKTIKAF